MQLQHLYHEIKIHTGKSDVSGAMLGETQWYADHRIIRYKQFTKIIKSNDLNPDWLSWSIIISLAVSCCRQVVYDNLL